MRWCGRVLEVKRGLFSRDRIIEWVNSDLYLWHDSICQSNRVIVLCSTESSSVAVQLCRTGQCRRVKKDHLFNRLLSSQTSDATFEADFCSCLELQLVDCGQSCPSCQMLMSDVLTQLLRSDDSSTDLSPEGQERQT